MKANPPLSQKELKLEALEDAIRSLLPEDRIVKLHCKACDDLYSKKLDRLTDGYCVTCHKELAYGVVPIMPGKNCCPGSSLPSNNDDPDENPALQNAIKVFEDGYWTS